MQSWGITLACVDVTVSLSVHIADDSIEDIRVSNGLNYRQWNEITVYGEEYIYEPQSTYAGDPMCIKGRMERDEDGTRGQCHLKSDQGQGH